MTRQELKDLFLYMVHDSGYYKRVDEDIEDAGIYEPSTPSSPVPVLTEKIIYEPNFKD